MESGFVAGVSAGVIGSPSLVPPTIPPTVIKHIKAATNAVEILCSIIEYRDMVTSYYHLIAQRLSDTCFLKPGLNLTRTLFRELGRSLNIGIGLSRV
jgi:hypothetical protein